MKIIQGNLRKVLLGFALTSFVGACGIDVKGPSDSGKGNNDKGDNNIGESDQVTDGDYKMHLDNPFEGARWYINSAWSENAKSGGGKSIANQSTAVWMDRIGAITDGMGLKGHLDAAVSQGADLITVVIYDLPNRDCSANASNGELKISENGFHRYKHEYIDPIADLFAKPEYKKLRIVTIVEPDSLPNLVTNLDQYEACREANGPGGYVEGIQYALNKFASITNVYTYLDIGHSGWLGWNENFSKAIDLFATTIKNTEKGFSSVDGFVSNTSGYTPVREPYLSDMNKMINGEAIKSAKFFDWNPYSGELAFVQDWHRAMVEKGFPSTIGMLIDTSRNGWGGNDRPTQAKVSNNIEEYVNYSKVDKRLHRGNWCNQPGGIGERPVANPEPKVDAYVWIKPPGESDGISENGAPDPKDPAKQFDSMCDSNAVSIYDSKFKTGALKNAPHAGRWFQKHFDLLIKNAFPPIQDYVEDKEDIDDCTKSNSCTAESRYSVSGKTIYDNGKKIYLKGLNWFGFDTEKLELHGLWTGRKVEDFLKEIKEIGFNSLRIPVSPEAVDQKTKLVAFLEEAKKFNLYILVDVHNCSYTEGHTAAKPCSETKYTLKSLASLVKPFDNVIGIDLFNEPYDFSWDEWKQFVESSANAVHSVNPKPLIFAQGIGNKGLDLCSAYPSPRSDCLQATFWGENLVPMESKPLQVKRDKLVLSPHVYGPSVHDAHHYFKSGDFPGNMPSIWDSHFGFLAEEYPIAVGEFGGRYVGQDKAWQDALVQYLLSKNIEHFFYWSLNPNSGDTGGIYNDDWETMNNDKLELLKPLLSR